MFTQLHAASANSAAQDSGLSLIIMVGMFFLISYFVIIRPKQKQEKTQKQLMSSLSRGDEVVTYSGIMGKIVRIKDNYVVLNIADNTEVKIQKNYINNVLPKGTLRAI